MEEMDKLAALNYLTINNPICIDCARGSLEQIRLAAGLYQLVKDIVADKQDTYTQQELNAKIIEATTF